MRYLILPAVALLASLNAHAAPASEFLAPPQQTPVQTDKWNMSDCMDYGCRIVTENKPIKKTVYECRDVPFCLHRLPKFGHHGCCPECGCTRFKRVLVKKEIIVGYECITKCVPEPLGKFGPEKTPALAPPAPLPMADAYYSGGDVANLPAPVIPAPPPPSPAPKLQRR